MASAIVANGRFYAGRYVCAPGACLADPHLHVCLFERPGRFNVVRYVLALFAGRLHKLADVRVVTAKRVRIEMLGDGGIGEPVQGDGSVLTEMPAEITIVPNALWLVVHHRPAPERAQP